ncbi:MAG: glycoside hydrolase family 28 protein [Oscillospiraceae bacterium]|nr:glycoside hydrolase family 28 protein [Oscillospiraceae bacterium]
MKISIIRCGARFAAAEITDCGSFDFDKKISAEINGREISFCGGISFIDGLAPETEYTVKASYGDETAETTFTTEYEFVTLDVRSFGAYGDGVHDDTVYIQAAIASCPEKSRVLVTKGKYKVTSLFLKSGVNLEIAAGAELIADNERFTHPIMPGMIRSFDEKSEYNLGTWEGNPLKMFAGIITAVDAENITVYGSGSINGNASHQDWWHNEKVMRGAFRPRLMFIERCKNVSVLGLKFMNSPSWTIHPYFSENVTLAAIRINNPQNSPNTDGIDVESCKNVRIEGVHFTLGDDCIALKSGKIYMGRKYGVPSENIIIRRCIMENGHGAVTLGSEMSAGIKNVLTEECLFRSTDRGLRIKTRRGRGDMAVIDGITFKNIVMDGVKTPFVANCFYFCDPDGRTSYVQDRNPLPVDERTPRIGKLSFENIACRNCHFAAAYFIGLPERKIEEISMKNIAVTFAENAEKGYPAMLCGIEEVSRRGIIAENVEKMTLANVCISGQTGEPAELCNVDEILK